VSIPPHLAPYLQEHLEHWAGDIWLFVGQDGDRMRGNAIYQAFVRARKRVGVKITAPGVNTTADDTAACPGLDNSSGSMPRSAKFLLAGRSSC
jgi:hypothetical protein